MNPFNQTSIVIQKYPEFRVLHPDHPCVNNLKEVYNYKRDGNYRGLLSNVNFYNAQTRKRIDPVSEGFLLPEKGDLTNKELVKDLTSNVMNTTQVSSSRIDIVKEVSDLLLDNPVITYENDEIGKTEPEISQKIGFKTRFTGDELLNLDIDVYVDIVEELIPTSEISVLAGIGGIGKSLFYEQICLTICFRKKEFLGRKVNAKHNSVLIIATEDNEKRISSRIKKQLKKISPEAKSIPGLVVITTGKDLLKTIRTEFGNKSYDLVVIDALGDVLSDESYSGSVVREFYDGFEQIMREFGTTFLIVHHEGKSQSRDGRTRILGSVAIVDRARSVFTLSKDNKTDLRTLKIVKSNNISDDKIGKPTHLKLDPETLTFSVVTGLIPVKDKKEVGSASSHASGRGSSSESNPGRKRDQKLWAHAIELFKSGMKQNEIAKEVNMSAGTISRWIKKFLVY